MRKDTLTITENGVAMLSSVLRFNASFHRYNGVLTLNYAVDVADVDDHASHRSAVVDDCL